MAFALLVASRAKAGASASHSALLGLTRKLSGLCPNAMKAAATIDLNRLTTNTATTTTRWSFYSSLQRTRQACVSGLFSISAAQAMRRSFQVTPSRHFTYDSDSERGYIPSRNSVETTFNFKPIALPYPKMFRKRHKRLLQRLEFARLQKAIRKRNTKEAKVKKLEKRRERWKAAVRRREEWKEYMSSKAEAL